MTDRWTSVYAMGGASFGLVVGAAIGALASGKNKHVRGALIGSVTGAAIGVPVFIVLGQGSGTGVFKPVDPSPQPTYPTYFVSAASFP
jgi:uncharacterized membrane protein